MKKAGWFLLGAVLLSTAAVVGVLLLRQPPLVETRDVETVFIYINPHGYKEITDPQQQKETLKLLNGLHREEMPDEDDRKGSHSHLRIFYKDGSWDSLFFMQSKEAYTNETAGVTFPAGEYMALYPEGYFRVADGTQEALKTLYDGIDQDPVKDLPDERRNLSPTNNRRLRK